MRHIIYKTTNILNGKVYYGRHSSENIDDGYLGSGKLIKLAIRKYGRENFKREILEECDTLEILIDRERSIVCKDLVNDVNAYNITIGGSGSNTIIRGESWKRKISRSMIGNKNALGSYRSLETKCKISKAKLGKKHTEESKRKMSESRLGVRLSPHSEETKRKISESKLRYHSNK